MRYAIQIDWGVDLLNGSTPLPEGAIEPVSNWEEMIVLPWYYRKILDGQVLEKTEAEKQMFHDAHPPTVEELQEQAQQHLSDTDWYVIRESEIQTLVPGEITTSRQNAREIL